MSQGPNEDPEENLKSLLKDLGKLSKRYGLQVGGCGDCGSPWVSGMRRGAGTRLEHLHYRRTCKKYGSYVDHPDYGGR